MYNIYITYQSFTDKKKKKGEVLSELTVRMLLDVLEKKKELWEYLKGKDKRLYLWMRNGIMGGTMNLPGRGGRKISVEGYKICQKLFGFN